MKISNGCWIQKEGITAFFPQEVYFCDVKKDMVKLVAPTHHIKQRGDTLGGVNITLEIRKTGVWNIAEKAKYSV